MVGWSECSIFQAQRKKKEKFGNFGKISKRIEKCKFGKISGDWLSGDFMKMNNVIPFGDIKSISATCTDVFMQVTQETAVLWIGWKPTRLNGTKTNINHTESYSKTASQSRAENNTEEGQV